MCVCVPVPEENKHPVNELRPFEPGVLRAMSSLCVFVVVCLHQSSETILLNFAFLFRCQRWTVYNPAAGGSSGVSYLNVYGNVMHGSVMQMFCCALSLV